MNFNKILHKKPRKLWTKEMVCLARKDIYPMKSLQYHKVKYPMPGTPTEFALAEQTLIVYEIITGTVQAIITWLSITAYFIFESSPPEASIENLS